MNKTELAGKIKALEGLTNEEKTALLGLLREQKKYGIVWEDKPEDVEQQLATELPVLTEVKDRFIKGSTPDAPNHILIEGDNLHALTSLSYTHEGKLDVIYIDPPYNTGNKDFVYNDTFVDKEDGYRHSKWLSFMNKRLKIAKRLLSDRGVIFISIDDNEQAQLKILCDEIFGENNLVGNIIWEKADSPRMDAKIVSSRHDFIVTYAKNILTLPIHKIPVNEIPAHYNKEDKEGRRYYLKPLRYMGNADAREDRPNMYYPITAPDGTEVYPKRADGSDGRWRWSPQKLQEEFDRLEFIKTKNGWSVNTRLYADSIADIPVETIWFNKDVDSNRQAIALIKDIFGSEKTFTNPKPVRLNKRIISIVGDKHSIVLDFFAGSGTTLHATMQLNAEDGGKRQCILVTNNENGICENVTYERNKRVINGYTTPNGNKVEGLQDNTLRYYKTDFVSAERTNSSKRALMAAATDMLCIKNNIYQEEPTLGGRKLKASVARHFCEGGKEMLVVYNEDAVPAVAELLRTIDVEGKIIVYVFSNTNYAYNDDFQEVADKIELCALPDAIYRAYKSVISRVKPVNIGEDETNSQEDEAEIQQEPTLNFEEEAQQ